MLTQDDLKYIVNDLYKFYRVFVASHFQENLPAPHIKALSKELTKLYLGEFKRLVVNMPPQHSKSSLLTVAYPLFLIFHHPETNILIVNNSATLSEKFGISLREYIKEYGPAFNVYLSDVKHSNSHLMFCNKEGDLYPGSIRLVGAGGSITGQTLDVIIIDDPYAGFDDITPSLLQKKIDWWNTIILQRLRENCKLILLHTRWHSNDLSGYLKKNRPDDYKFVEFPAIKKDGTPLWAEAYTIETLEKRREEMGERLFEAIYQQKPLDQTSDFFEIDKVKFGVPPEYTVDKIVRAWDIASGSSVDNSDFTAGAKMIRSGDVAILTDLVHGKFGNDTKDKVVRTAFADGLNTQIAIETGVGAAAKLLFQEWKLTLPGYILKEMKPITSKVDRATPLQNAILDGRFYINISDDVLRDKIISEMRSFPAGAHDDIIDSLAYAYNELFHSSEKTANLGWVYL